MDHDDRYSEADDARGARETVDPLDAEYRDHDAVTADDSPYDDDPDDVLPEGWPLRDAARELARGTPDGRALAAKLEVFDNLDEDARAKLAPQLRQDIANIVARAITEANQRTEFEDALITWREAGPVGSDSPEWRTRHPLVAELLDVAVEVLAELGK